MLKIKCPNCGREIEIGKDQYNALLNDIEKEELDKRVRDQVKQIEDTYKAKLELEETKLKSSQDKKINELERKAAVLEEQLKGAEKDKQNALDKLNLSQKNELESLKKELDLAKSNAAVEAQNLKTAYEAKLKDREDEIKRWKDFQLKNSTKDLGESLENYCREAFEEIRNTAYPNAYFEKDNEVDEEGKGDFIFRDYEGDIELVSIMFEMKNENDTTKTKHKNEDFFAKLDKNRKSKNCEYAVLVSMLEEDSKLYNRGIVDVSHRYPKMYVVRPTFFLTIISLIRNMAKNSYAYKKQVVEYQRENLDVTNFENAVKLATEKILNDYEKAGAIYSEVDKMCDDIVNKVEKFRKEFKTAAGWIEKAKNQLPNLEVRKLTRGNKTMKEKFAEIEANEPK